MTRLKASGSTWSTDPKAPMPALATTTSIPPNRSTPALTTSRNASRSRTSATRPTARSAPMRATVCCRPASSTSQRTSRAPRSASAVAVPAPMPLPAPVMNATRPARDGVCFRLEAIATPSPERARTSTGCRGTRLVPGGCSTGGGYPASAASTSSSSRA